MNQIALCYLIPILFLLSAACGQRSKVTDFVRQQDIDAAEYFSDRVTDFQVRVFYEQGIEPATGPIDGAASAWVLTFDSFSELFNTHKGRKVTVPRTLAQMTAIPRKNVAEWDELRLVALANSLSTGAAPGQVVAAVIFIGGNYKGEDTVLGLHFSGVRAAFIFKDNLTRFSGTQDFLNRIEQATVVHELGHVIGLVNNGVPMAIPHEDPEHPHHSTDIEDVMYWDLVAAVAHINRSSLFGKNSLADAHAFHQP